MHTSSTFWKATLTLALLCLPVAGYAKTPTTTTVIDFPVFANDLRGQNGLGVLNGVVADDTLKSSMTGASTPLPLDVSKLKPSPSNWKPTTHTDGKQSMLLGEEAYKPPAADFTSADTNTHLKAEADATTTTQLVEYYKNQWHPSKASAQ